MNNSFISLRDLTNTQKTQYRTAIINAFPPIIGESQVIKNYWMRLEKYYSQFQFFLISENEEIIGFINTVPFQFSQSLIDLPDRGWDWMLKKGIHDFEENIQRNYLGGLQIIVRSKFQNKGFSKTILHHVKGFIAESDFTNLIIPIRPTKKHQYPKMSMLEYMKLKNDNEIFDPWIKTHLKSGAKILKVCERSMIMNGDLDFWEKILKQKIKKSGTYKLDGALSLISIDFENDFGEYVEPNIWIKY